MRAATILIFILLIGGLFVPATAWNITTDRITETSISWNVSEKTGAIVNLAYDGINITDFDPSAIVLIQSNLKGGELHTIYVTAVNNSYGNATATTESSNEDEYYSEQATLWGFANDWGYLILIIFIIACGLVIHKLFFFIASFISLYALAKWINENPTVITDIWHIQFYIYGALFIIPLIMWAIKRKGR